jgi:hypothetical protein
MMAYYKDAQPNMKGTPELKTDTLTENQHLLVCSTSCTT